MGRLTDQEKKRIDVMFELGYSSRKISKELWGTKTRKSTVNDYLASKMAAVSYHPKVLLIDIETSPEVSMHWRRFKENITEDQNLQYTKVLGFCYKWLGEADVYSVYPEAPPVFMEDSSDEYGIIEQAHALFTEADIIVGHNVDRFDVPVLNARMIYHGFNKPRPFKTIDTLKIAKTEFRFPQNRLDVICNYLGLGRKVEHEGFQLWRKCMMGDPDAWAKMEEYNIGDVVLLEELYLKLRSWTPRVPNMSLTYPNSIARCPTCGSHDIEVSEGFAFTQVSVFDLYHCNDCGGWARGRKNVKTTEQRENVLTTVR